MFPCIFVKLTNQRGNCWSVSPKSISWVIYIKEPIQITTHQLAVELPELHSKKNTILKQIKQIARLLSLKSDVKHIHNLLENASGLKWIKCFLL